MLTVSRQSVTAGENTNIIFSPDLLSLEQLPWYFHCLLFLLPVPIVGVPVHNECSAVTMMSQDCDRAYQYLYSCKLKVKITEKVPYQQELQTFSS